MVKKGEVEDHDEGGAKINFAANDSTRGVRGTRIRSD